MIPAGVATSAEQHYRQQARLVRLDLYRQNITAPEAARRLLAIAASWCLQ